MTRPTSFCCRLRSQRIKEVQHVEHVSQSKAGSRWSFTDKMVQVEEVEYVSQSIKADRRDVRPETDVTSISPKTQDVP